jgi:hypothetical protein
VIDQKIQLCRAVLKQRLRAAMRRREQRSHRGKIARAQRRPSLFDPRNFFDDVARTFERCRSQRVLGGENGGLASAVLSYADVCLADSSFNWTLQASTTTTAPAAGSGTAPTTR